jgi:hypothetical protein
LQDRRVVGNNAVRQTGGTRIDPGKERTEHDVSPCHDYVHFDGKPSLGIDANAKCRTM